MINALTHSPAPPQANGYQRSFNRLLPSRAIPLPFGGDYGRIKVIYQVGRVLSLGIDTERVIGAVTRESAALNDELEATRSAWAAAKGQPDDADYLGALEEYNATVERLSTAINALYWRTIELIAAHLIDHFESDFPDLALDPLDPVSLWQLEPEDAQRAGKRPVLEYLVNPRWLQEVAGELTDPKSR